MAAQGMPGGRCRQKVFLISGFWFPVAFLSLFCATTLLQAQQVFTVTTTFDGGPGSYRQALEGANAEAGADTIRFDIPGDGPHVLKPRFAYPIVEETLVVDGFSQPGAVMGTSEIPSVVKIVLDGFDALDQTIGLDIKTDSCVVEGLNIVNFGHSGLIVGGSHNLIRHNLVGIDVAGGQAKGNGYRDPDSTLYDGIWIWRGTDNRIEHNVLSGNAASGIWVSSPDGGNTVRNNRIGTDARGGKSVPNDFGIVFQNSPGNLAEANVVSGNLRHGIVVANFKGKEGRAYGNVIRGNYVGLNASGTESVANGQDGILINGPSTRIGDTAPDGGNVISGNGESGIVIVSPQDVEPADSNAVVNNIVGLTADGSAPLPNRLSGIVIEESSHNVVGGDSANAGNVVSGNLLTGVWIAEGVLEDISTSHNRVLGNLLGTDANGIRPVGNGWDGVMIQASSHNLVADNVMVDQGFAGIFVRDPQAASNVIQANYIGRLRDGTPVPNRDAGIDIAQARETLVGGEDAGHGNYIAYNGAAGVTVNDVLPAPAAPKTACEPAEAVRIRSGAFVSNRICTDRRMSAGTQKTDLAPVGNTIRRNYMTENGGRGIELGRGIPTPNDPGDGDLGANNLQNTPILASAFGSDQGVILTYSVDTSADAADYPLLIDLYVAGIDGEGLEYLGSVSYTLPRKRDVVTLRPPFNLRDGAGLVATATDAQGNTSEFSPVVNLTGGTHVANEEEEVPAAAVTLHAHYPNPFSEATILSFALRRQEHAVLVVYDTHGRMVEKLFDAVALPGTHQVVFDASDLPSGTYLYRLTAGEEQQTRWMTVVR